MTNVIALDDQDRFNEAIRDRLMKSGAGARARKPRAADYAADVLLEGVERQFDEPSPNGPPRGRDAHQSGITADVAIELFELWARRMSAWMDLGWRVASAQSFAAATAQQFRFASSALADCRQTDERIRARLRG